jgi:hypothetical protein
MDIYRLETLYGHMTVTQGFVVGDQAEACGRFHELVLFPDLSDNLFFRSGKLLREGLEQCLRRLMVRCRFLGGEQFPSFGCQSVLFITSMSTSSFQAFLDEKPH